MPGPLEHCFALVLIPVLCSFFSDSAMTLEFVSFAFYCLPFAVPSFCFSKRMLSMSFTFLLNRGAVSK